MENKKIVLTHMEIHQFKGIQQLTLDFSPEENSLYGANATGKTTVYDALLWLLFDRDSSGSSKFAVKPIAATQGVTPTVSACFTVNGQPLQLQKTLREKWEKHRGGEARFAGDTREYFVDNVPRKETEYKRIVSGYIDETRFKLLTNLYTFARDMHWKDRRALLAELCELSSEYEIASGEPKFAALLDVLQKHTVSEYKTMLTNQRKGINAELNTMPVRIDECERMIAHLETLPFQQAKEELSALQSALEQAQTEQDCMNAGILLAQAENKKRSAENDLRALELKNQQYHATQGIQTVDSRAALLRELSQRKAALQIAQNLEETAERKLKIAQAHLQEYREKWSTIKNEPVVIDTVCPTCGQAFPPEKIKAIQEKLSAEKRSRLQALTMDADILKNEIVELESSANETREQVNSLTQECQSLQEQLDAIPEQKQSAIQDLPEYQEQKLLLCAKLEEIEEEIARFQKMNQQDSVHKRTIQGLQEKIQEKQSVISQEQQLTDTRRRIAELQQKQRAKAAKLDEIDSNIDLCDDFLQYKANLTEDRINNRFRLAKFRMFRKLVNGGLEDCCEITVNDVPYSDLNTAMKVNVGLDCINALSEHFSVSVPLFVDNAESVTQLLDMSSQRIRLIVSAEDKELRLA